jgi:hypothetical protein
MRDPLDLADDAALTALLSQLRDATGGHAPFPVDVADRVMARVAFAGPVAQNDVGLPQLARWAAAAAAAGIGLVATVASRAPSLPQIVEGVGRTTVEGTSLAVKTGGTMATLGTALARAAAVMLEAAQAAVTSRQAALGIVSTATILIMIGVTTYVVGRDLRTGESS